MSQVAVDRPEASVGPQPERSRSPRFADPASGRARLSLIVPVRSEAPMAPFVALLSLLLIGGVAGLLAFNTSMQQTSFAATDLEQRASALTAKRQALQIDLDDLRDPQALAVRAKALGMVLPVSPAFVRLSDGRVVGDPKPAGPDQAMRINPLPAAKPKVLAPAPKVITVPRKSDRRTGTAPRGGTGSQGSSTDDRSVDSGSTTGTRTGSGTGSRTGSRTGAQR